MAAPKKAPIYACANCRFFRASAAEPAPGFVPRGWCRRFPQELSKDPAEWCGEHKPKE